MPSVGLALDLKRAGKSLVGAHTPPDSPIVDPQDAFYALNPSGDLTETQTALQPLFEAQPRWQGLAGTAPDPGTIAAALQSRQLFVYCGHGSGEQYLPQHRMRLLRCSAAGLIMGCSSGRLRRSVCPVSGGAAASGAVLTYLVAGERAA